MSGVTVRLITVFACESQPIIIEGLRLTLEASEDLMLAGAAHPDQALPAIADIQPDVVLVSAAEPPDDIFGFLKQLREICPTARPVLWVQQPEAVDSGRARELGVRAILRKSLPAGALLSCLAAVGRGGTWTEAAGSANVGGARGLPRLTPRERQILRLLCQGLKNRQIAEALAIAPGTVKVHLMHIFEKTGARNRYELAVGARRLITGEGAGLARAG